MEAPSEVHWESVALALQEQALRKWMGLPVLLVQDNVTGERIRIFASPTGYVVGYRKGMASLFRRGFAKDWLLDVLDVRRTYNKSQELLRG